MCRPVLFLWEREDRERDARERDAREACASCRRGFVGGWLLGCRNSAKTASKILKLASEAAQTVRIFEATQISASQESAPLLQSPSTGSTRLTGWLFMAVVCVGLLGSWMSRQRCAGRLVGEAEFACGLTVGAWGRRRCAGRQGGKAEFACGLPVGVWGRRRCAGRQGGKAEFACGLTGDVWDRCRCAGRQGGKVGVPCDLMGVSE